MERRGPRGDRAKGECRVVAGSGVGRRERGRDGDEREGDGGSLIREGGWWWWWWWLWRSKARERRERGLVERLEVDDAS